MTVIRYLEGAVRVEVDLPAAPDALLEFGETKAAVTADSDELALAAIKRARDGLRALDEELRRDRRRLKL